MTFITGNILVLAVKLERGFIVIKVSYFPINKIMTFRTISNAFIVKLFEMLICMAVNAGRSKI